MTSNIDASLRRPNLHQTPGDRIPDSKPLLEDTPQLIMEPGVSRPVFKFLDGDGLTDAFGNVYDGYGGAGGSSSNFTNTPADSIDEQVDVASDLDVIQYNAATEFYEAKSREAAGLAVVGGATPTDGQQLFFNFANDQYEPADSLSGQIGGAAPEDLDLLQYVDANNQYEPKTYAEAELPRAGGTAPTDGQMLLFVAANSRYEAADFVAPAPGPFDITDFISGIIEKPQNRAYTIVLDLPFDIVKTGDAFSSDTGPGTISFPANGAIAAGNDIQITVSASTGASEFFRFQIDYTRTLTP